MNRYIKIGILSGILLVPLLVFLFIKIFGKNHYKVPIYYPLDVINNGAVGDTVYHTISSYTLLTQDSAIFVNTPKGIKVAYFFFTRCPGICPIMTSNLLQVQEAFMNSADVVLTGISVDADYDRPAILKKYANKYDMNSKMWYLLTGSADSIYHIGFDQYKLPADTADKTLHSEKIALLDHKNRIRGYYTGTDNVEIDRLITEIKILQYEYINP
ncbi:MAG: SCO family protein [Cytophagales bacterium]|nr:SCO family protein [Cytophagales bacterium]